MPNTPPSFNASRTIVVSGATGMIGSALVARLRANGHTVRRLVRSSSSLQAGDVVWDPGHGILPASVIEGAEAVVHLAGAPIAQRWTAAHKEEILESRVRSTALLARTIAAAAHKPAVMLSGSAIGYYGDRGDAPVDETSTPGSGFLARVVQDWEAAAGPAADAGTRVVLLRTGIVLSPRGGALERLLVPFRLGVGGPIGGGDQWMSWISLEDQIRAMEFALFGESLSGAVNLVAPNPVTNATFASTLGRVLNRPALIPVPGLALELLYGEMARATILTGQRVRPAALAAAGFEFHFPTLEQALRHELAN
ncbi:TIGR01777 family oxidoreductase [soil metagenome]